MLNFISKRGLPGEFDLKYCFLAHDWLAKNSSLNYVCKFCISTSDEPITLLNILLVWCTRFAESSHKLALGWLKYVNSGMYSYYFTIKIQVVHLIRLVFTFLLLRTNIILIFLKWSKWDFVNVYDFNIFDSKTKQKAISISFIFPSKKMSSIIQRF